MRCTSVGRAMDNRTTDGAVQNSRIFNRSISGAPDEHLLPVLEPAPRLIMRILGLLMIAALVTSCASTTSVPNDFQFDAHSAQALIVGSITYESAIGRHGVEATARDGGPGFAAGVGYGAWPPLGPQFDEELRKKGGTFAVAVRPGQYTLQRWVVQSGQRTRAPAQPLLIPFNAVAGRMTYLGNFDFDADGNVTLADRAERDLPILRKRTPALGTAPPAVAIRSGARIDNLGKDDAPRVDPTLYVAGAGDHAQTQPATTAFDSATMASVQDTASQQDSVPRGTRFFVIAEIDGKPVDRDAATASVSASRGMGPNMRVVEVERPVPAGKVRLKLRASIGHAAPIQAIFAAITSDGPREAVGVVDVALQPDGRYRVNGVIDELRTEVWLEDARSQQVVPGSRIAGALPPEGVKAAAAPLRFTCCNLHYDPERWISNANWIERPFLPAGTPIRVYEFRKDRAKAVIDGKVAWLGLDYGDKHQTVDQFVSKVAVKDDPSETIKTYPADVQAAIRAGKVMPGMTKEQAIVALGYPRVDLTPSLDAPSWSYMSESDEKFALSWNAEGRLVAVEASPELRALVLMAP